MGYGVNLSDEWQRLELLGKFVSNHRQGKTVSEEHKQKLKDLNDRVFNGRSEENWPQDFKKYKWDSLQLDILMAVLGPVADPHLGWMYQELQPGVTSHYPSPALIQEMFFLEKAEVKRFQKEFQRNSPLVNKGLVQVSEGDFFKPVKPTAELKRSLLGLDKGPDSLQVFGAVQIPTMGNFESLVLPEYAKKSLKEYLLWVTHWDKVVEQWKAPVLGGPVALFTGPSGTGKTYTAGVIANELGWPLYRIDLGMLISKYIGETESNLNKLFDDAHGKEVVILIDEADSMFAKRGEVKEARDRYANMEVSHLLTRIERHKGPCILTTNLKRHVDHAFFRRFQLVLEFPRPGPKFRKQLWKSLFPVDAPIAKDVHPELLGEKINITGGQIRNVIVQASFLAAGDNTEIDYSHLSRALWSELSKEGNEVTLSDLGILGAYFPEKSRL